MCAQVIIYGVHEHVRGPRSKGEHESSSRLIITIVVHRNSSRSRSSIIRRSKIRRRCSLALHKHVEFNKGRSIAVSRVITRRASRCCNVVRSKKANRSHTRGAPLAD